MGIKHILESQQFDRDILFYLFERADELRKNSSMSLNGKILATLFYEPSTRTRLSFESAMIRLGGKVISTENAKEFSSAIKGESIEDSIRVISGYSDCIVMRHNEGGAAFIASKVSKVPIVNAGDGKGQHPTQAILDVYTIYKEIKRLDKLKIAMVGDLSTGRTVRSLCYLLGKFNEIEIIFVSPENLRIGEDIKEYLKKHNVKFVEKENLNDILPEVDVIYMTRIQKERMNMDDYEKANGKYIISKENFELINENSIIMHPLPHVEEIDLSVDVEQKDKRIAYFRQAENGLYIRMALLDLIINNRYS
ncbi:aspartate carbamoyltransferase [Candidatus Pacearchaeota archaeon]|jgi:aspartate carbamoyltransferase catalytic subunit|nr:aspartate carbamoyltransferase [Candidatus Pacearchaeota archaeon]|tara:strand:+ start:6249 stop:7172 length:924 start_codon:yes stop_codon:yes gene_type:complete